ncbi:hypothetical protein LXL04_030529 [Taraxacum kok-saghyz]
MDANRHLENARQKQHHGQWLMQQQPSMKQIMSIMAERDAAIQERNLALSEKKTALAGRDMALLQRDSAIAERNSAIMERDNAIATLQYRENSINTPTHHRQHFQQQSGADLISPAAPNPEKSRKPKRTKEVKSITTRKTLRSTKKVKVECDDLNKAMSMYEDWNSGGVPIPVCSCTGVFRQCYKWGNGGWQSACCTTTMSMYPLPSIPNRRHARVGGRKMSGSVFNKLVSRLADEGCDLLNPVDLKEHWAKHGTNRYITIK